MLKLRFSKPSYKKYMGGKACVCSYKCKIFNSVTKEIIDEFNVSGAAKLANGDTLSDLGAKLADSRAKLVAYKKAANIISDEQYDNFVDVVNSLTDICYFSDFMHLMKRREIKHIKKLKV